MANPRKTTRTAPVKERVRVDAGVLPRRSLEAVIPIARALHETYAGQSATSDELANAVGVGATTNNWKYMLWAAQAYGIIRKDENGNFALGETGRKIVAPEYPAEELEGRRKAVLTPTLLSRFFSDYNNHTLPAPAHLPNVLQNRYSVPRERLDEAIELIKANGRYASILDTSQSTEQPTVRLSAEAPPGSSQIGTSENDAFGTEGTGTSEAIAKDATEWRSICFFITPIGDDGTDVRKHADMMLKHLVEPVLTSAGFKVVRADKIEKSGLITQQVFEHLVKARLCIADLSFNNPNAFYELGIRHICKLATIQVIRKGDRIPFDVSQGRTIVIDTSDVYTVMDRFESARRELTEHVSSVQVGNPGEVAEDNPVHYYLPTLKVTLPE